MAPKEEPGPAAGLNDFVKKLYQMLLEDRYLDVVRWTPAGTSFVVLNTNEFTKVILPTHFKHSNFASFVRQLNKYDFHKVKISNEEKQNYQYGDDAWEFQHPDFRQNDMEALENIRRKAPTKKDASADSTSQLSSQIKSLKEDVAKLQHGLKITNEKLRAVLEAALAHKSYNERQFRAMSMLVQCLTQAGIKIPPLDLPNPNLLRMVQAPPPVGAFLPVAPQLDTKHAAIPNAPPDEAAKVRLQAAQQSAQPALPAGASHLRQHSGEQPPVVYDPVSTMVLPNAKFHVLLVEDDNVCIQLCRKFLMKYGCSVTVVTDGLKAISTVEHTQYDLVLMDIVMPNLDGATATSIIRSFDTKLPIIAMTGNIQDNDLVNYLQNGMSDILAKPFTKDDLYLILSKYLLQPKQEFPDLSSVAEFSTLPIESTPGTVNMPPQQIPTIPGTPSPGLGATMLGPMEGIEPGTKKQRLN